MLITIDDRRKVVVPGNEAETIIYAAEHFIKCAKNAIEAHGTFFVALSGGSTPKQIFQKLALDYKNAIDWKKVYLFWSDERAVPANHPDSNYKMAMDAGFSKLPVDPTHIFRMKGEGDINLHAAEYESIIIKTLGLRHFDLIMLGIGEDGHTASLFPGTKGLSIKDKLVIANEIPQKKTWRMTFTFPIINSAHNITFYALGKNKQEILKKILTTDSFPSSHIGTEIHPALWILDREAAKLLESS